MSSMEWWVNRAKPLEPLKQEALKMLLTDILNRHLHHSLLMKSG